MQAFDREGGEKYWTVTGDNVTALTMCDVNGDSQAELLVSMGQEAVHGQMESTGLGQQAELHVPPSGSIAAGWYALADWV